MLSCASALGFVGIKPLARPVLNATLEEHVGRTKTTSACSISFTNSPVM